MEDYWLAGMAAWQSPGLSIAVSLVCLTRIAAAAEFDVVVYGASCAGVAAAVAAGQLGMKVGLYEPLPMIGGMCAAGNLALHDSGPAGGLGEVYAMLNAQYYNVTRPVSQPESFVSVQSFNTMLRNARCAHHARIPSPVISTRNPNESSSAVSRTSSWTVTSPRLREKSPPADPRK